MVQKEECEYRLAFLQLFCEGVKVAYASEVCSVCTLLISTHHSTRTRERRPTIGVLLSPQSEQEVRTRRYLSIPCCSMYKCSYPLSIIFSCQLDSLIATHRS